MASLSSFGVPGILKADTAAGTQSSSATAVTKSFFMIGSYDVCVADFLAALIASLNVNRIT